MSERSKIFKHVAPSAGISDLSALRKEQNVSEVGEQVRSALVNGRNHRPTLLGQAFQHLDDRRGCESIKTGRRFVEAA